ncbi:MAG: hypothetical protein V3U71_01745 [Cocleimonas sp.]
MKISPICLTVFLTLMVTACGSGSTSNNTIKPTVTESPINNDNPDDAVDSSDDSDSESNEDTPDESTDNNSTNDIVANISEVTVQGEPSKYTFFVSITSDETGCEQYADWWEVLDNEGKLIYRRVLGHSHVAEQPFTRDGNPVNIAANDFVFVRAHMNNVGYSGDVFSGSVNSGFLKAANPPIFPQGIDELQPLPSNCAF